MGKIKSYLPVLISLIISTGIMFLVGFKSNASIKPNEIYKVYVDGEFIGAIRSKKALENYINNEEANIKEEYGVSKVYMPTGIDIEKDITYDGKILSEKKIYQKIKETKNFTIKGYIVEVIHPEDEDEKDKKSSAKEEDNSNNDEGRISENVDFALYMTKKDLFDKAAKNALNAFVSSKEIENFKNDTQPKIISTGSIIENIYIGQTINIKEAYISTDALVFTNVSDLTRYLLFGSLDNATEYTIQVGDTIETVAEKNKLSTNEFLLVNPEFTNANNLLIPGQKVNVDLIDPILDFVVERNTVEDMDYPYQTREEEDSTMAMGTREVVTEGVKGVQRVTEKIKLVNGHSEKVYITNTEIIKEPVTEVVKKGTRPDYTYTSGTPAITVGNWGWPATSTYISDPFGWTDGRYHKGIDIATNCGTPVFAIQEGTVLDTYSACDGSYSWGCGGQYTGGYGNFVWISHPEGISAIYAHLLPNVVVYPGQYVSKGQVIGYLGSSGTSTGCHLHFGVYTGGGSYGGSGSYFNPFSLYQ